MAEGLQSQSEAIHEAIRAYDESRQKELATKGDLENARLELKRDIEVVRAEIKSAELRLLKWQIGIAVTILLVMAKGFNWLGF